MAYNEEDFLQLSGLQHFRFCRRQWALIHIEHQWAENYRTIDGAILHENAHDTDFQPFVNQKQARTAIVRRSFHRHTRSCNNRILSVGDFLILLHGKKHRPDSQAKGYNPHDKTSLFDTDRRRVEK